MINRLDNYILNLIFDYLVNKDNIKLYYLNKIFYSYLSKYQKRKIDYLLKNNYYTNSIKNIIQTNRNRYFNVSDSEIIENLDIKYNTYLIGIKIKSTNSGSMYKIYYDSYLEEYKYCHLLSTNIIFFNNFQNIQMLYLGGELIIVMNNRVKRYNLLTKIWDSTNIISTESYYNNLLTKISNVSNVTSTNSFYNNLYYHNVYYNNQYYNRILYKKYCIFDNKIFLIHTFINSEHVYESFPLSYITLDNDLYQCKIFFLDNNTKLITPRKDHSMVSFENKLWIAGGYSNLTYLDSVEVYDPKIGFWKEEEKMIRKRVNLKLEVIDGILYAIGGDIFLSEFHTISIERFDNLKRNWLLITSKKIVKSKMDNYTIFVLNNRIIFLNNMIKDNNEERDIKEYSIIDEDAQGDKCISIEEYNIDNNSWRSLKMDNIFNNNYIYSI